MAYGDFRECKIGMSSAFYATISFLTHFVRVKCGNYFVLPKPIQLKGYGVEIVALTVDEKNNLWAVLDEKENIELTKLPMETYELVDFMAGMEGLFV